MSSCNSKQKTRVRPDEMSRAPVVQRKSIKNVAAPDLKNLTTTTRPTTTI